MSDSYDVVLHGALEASQDVWAVFMPSVKEFVYNDGAPYGRGNALRYTWGGELDLEIKIDVWRDSAGIHAKRVY